MVRIRVYVCDNENLEHYNTGAYCKGAGEAGQGK